MTGKAIRCVSGLRAGRIAALLAVACASAASAGRLVINEIQVANVDRYIDPSYNYGAWIELYNPGMAAVQLNGCTLRHTDADGNVDLCRLGIGHGSVPSGGYGLLWFDHNSADGYYGGYAGTQIPFKLDADGGLIELLDGNGGLIDAASYPQCIARCSWARTADGGDAFGWTSQPTPKVSNGTSTFTDVRMEAPVVSAAGGVFRGSYRFTVAIPDGATLYYTTDGSTPEPGRSPVSRDGSFGGSENAVYRFMLSCDGKLDSPVVTRSFFNSLVGGGIAFLYSA